MIDVVCGLIEDGDGRVLACLRPEGKHLGGKWEFAGGKVEPGEDPAAALIRELQEELGVLTEIHGGLTPVIWDYGTRTIRLIPFICRIVSGDLYPHEHAEVKWIDRSSCMDLDWAAADIPILHEWIAAQSQA